MRRRDAIPLACALGVFGSVTPVWAQRPLDKLSIARPPSEDGTALYYALKTGMPQRYGLDIDVTYTSSGSAATTAVVAGTYDIAATSLLPIIAAYLRDIPVAVVAPLNLYSEKSPFGLLQMAVDAAYKTGADLNGKTIGVPALNDLNELATRAWVDKTGGDWRSLKFLEIPNSALDAAIGQHRIDAALLQGAQLDASLAAGSSKTLAPALSAIAPTFMAAVHIARREWATQHLDVLRRFNRMLAEASAYVGSHPAESAPLVTELTKIDLATVQKMQHRTIYAPRLDGALLQSAIDAAARYGQSSRAFPARDLILQ